MHSATKYLNGHSDLVAGALVTARADEAWTRMLAVRTQHGGILGPVEAWLLLRGMRTLFVRVRLGCANAQAIAEHFEHHALVEAVLYPGLAAFPGHAVAARQMQGGFGGMLSIRVAGGEAAAIATAARGARLETGDLARRGRKPDRAPRLGGGAGHPGGAGPVAAVLRHRGGV
jgi:cystathionine gamma-synthase